MRALNDLHHINRAQQHVYMYVTNCWACKVSSRNMKYVFSLESAYKLFDGKSIPTAVLKLFPSLNDVEVGKG